MVCQARKGLDVTQSTLPVTVTFLEQRARPGTNPLACPPGQKLALLRAEKPPVHFYRYIYDCVGRPYNWVSRTLINDESLCTIIHHPRVFIYILYLSGVPAGFAEIDARHASIPEIKFFGLVPDFTGRKLGPFFLSQIIDLAWSCTGTANDADRGPLVAANGPRCVRLETCTLDHPAALPLYQKFGFSVYDQRKLNVPVLPGFQAARDKMLTRNPDTSGRSDPFDKALGTEHSSLIEFEPGRS